MPRPPTQSEIREMLAAAGLRPRKRYGQHFLIDANLLGIVCREAELTPEDVVLEVGPGVGNLTGLLVEEAGWVVAAEIDAALAEVAATHLAGCENLDIVVGDVLADKHHLSPQVREVVRRRLDETGGRLKLVANLPYSAATPLLVELLLEEPVPSLLVFTVQEEVAQRLAAAPGTRAYGPVTVVVQALAQVEILRRLAPSVFWPRPQVYSSMVRIWPSPARRRRIPDLGKLRRVIDGLFGHRRKVAPKSLSLADPEGRTPEEWARMLESVGLDPAARGETYPVEGIIALAAAL